MSFVSLQDRTFQMDAALFEPAYIKYHKMLEPGKVVMIYGTKRRASILIQKVEEL